jgi:hypothetical protein
MMESFTIYWSAHDYPGQFVVRRFEIRPTGVEAKEIVATCPTLDEARSHIPLGLIPFPRDPVEDPPQIIETWL